MIPYSGFYSFTVLGFEVPMWGLFQLIAVLLALFICYKEHKRLKLDYYEWKLMIFLFTFFALLGMRLYHLFFVQHSETIIERLTKLLFQRKGIDSAGGVLGIIVMTVYLWVRKLNIKRYLDSLALPGTALIIFARIGCFFALCEIGLKTTLPWAITYHEGIRHPIALYYILNGIFMFVLFYHLRKAKLPDGFLINAFFVIYPFMRFILDFLRVDPGNVLWAMSQHQIVYFLVFIIATIHMWLVYGKFLRSKA